MKRILGWTLAAILVLGVGLVGWLYFAGGSGEPSTELTTPPIAEASTTTASESTDPTADPVTTVPSTVTSAGQAFVIDPSLSVASFEIDEVLRGSPKHVVGTTSELAGQIQVDPADLTSAEFSQILINARTFETDSGNRDRAIRGPVILNSASDEFEFISFDVTSVDGLSGAAAVGEPIDFTVTGDLKIKDTTQSVTFDVSATFIDENTIEGSAQTTVLRDDFGLGIPQAPGVADVSQEVVIRLDFVATSV
ncbi:MAG TPA: YceI family protein [Acidimicrobiia bacterium]